MLALTQAGMSREDAYRAVQQHAMETWLKGGDFEARLAGDPNVARHLKRKEIAALFDLGYHFKHVDRIFARVFGKAPARRKRH